MAWTRPIELIIEVGLGLWFLAIIFRHDERKPLLAEASRNTKAGQEL